MTMKRSKRRLTSDNDKMNQEHIKNSDEEQENEEAEIEQYIFSQETPKNDLKERLSKQKVKFESDHEDHTN